MPTMSHFLNRLLFIARNVRRFFIDAHEDEKSADSVPDMLLS